jgi:hypothetical protein
LSQVRKDRESVDQSELMVGRKRKYLWISFLRVEGAVVDVAMAKFEARVGGRQIVISPLDHTAVQVNTEVALRSRNLLQKPASDAPAAAAEIEHGLIESSVEARKEERAAGIVEIRGISWPNEFAHLERR